MQPEFSALGDVGSGVTIYHNTADGICPCISLSPLHFYRPACVRKMCPYVHVGIGPKVTLGIKWLALRIKLQ